MTNESPKDQYETRFSLVEELREEFLIEFGGFDIVAGMLAMKDDDLNRVDPDFIDTLGQIVEILIKLCGDRKRGLKWLITCEPYSQITGNDPYYCLQHGSFWPLAIMLECLQILDKYRPPDLIRELFERQDRAIVISSGELT